MIEAAVLALACGRSVARVPVRLPAPIVTRTGCGTYEIGIDGRVAAYRRDWAPGWAPHATARAAPGVWIAHPHGRLALYRAGRLLWRSRIRMASDEALFHDGAIAIGLYDGDAPAPTLWMAHVGGREFRVSGSEEPIAWTAGGLVTQHGNRIRVRAADGSLRRGFGYGHGPAYDSGDRTVVFVTHDGVVVRTDGRHVWRLARVRPSSWVAILNNRMLQVSTGRRTVFLRSDGSRVGTAGAVDAAVGLPGQRSVVYVTARGRETRAGAAVAGTNVVYRLDASGRTRLYSHRVPFLSCGETGGVSYAGGWVLFADSEGPAAVLDPHGHRRPLELTRALRVLQPRRASRSQLFADWRSNWR